MSATGMLRARYHSNIDISCDWLYKSKKRVKHSSNDKKQATSGPTLTSPVLNESVTSPTLTAVSSAPRGTTHKKSGSLQRSVSLSVETSTSAHKQAPLSPTPATSKDDSHIKVSGGRKDVSGTKTPERIPSLLELSGTQVREPTPQGTLGSSILRRKSRTSSSSKTKAEKDKIRKSVFASIFGKKAVPSPTSNSPQSSRDVSPRSSKVDLPSINTSTHSGISTDVEISVTPPPVETPQTAIAKGVSPSPFSPQASTVHHDSRPYKPTYIPDEDIQAALRSVSLKRVRFSADSFAVDPPQQLPSRKPKIGNVLIPEDMLCDVPSISKGVPFHDSCTIGMNGRAVYDINSNEYKKAVATRKALLKESEKHQREAHLAAKRIEREIQHFKHGARIVESSKAIETAGGSSPLEVERTTPFDTSHLGANIDQPLHVHEHHFGDEGEANNNSKELTLDIIYTRCCHLREILPIPSTLKQLTGKTAPLQVLKFLNPKPTLIELLAFCDFIAITDINTIVFDNVILTSEMFDTLICSLCEAKDLDKLSLRNVPIDSANWLLFCKFLLHNKSITKLELSQTHLKTIAKDLPKDAPPELIEKVNEQYSRHNLDWNLFAICLMERRGRPIEELLLNGVKFSKYVPLEIFQNVLAAFSQQKNSQPSDPKTLLPLKLGLALSEISPPFLKHVMNWMSPSKNTTINEHLCIIGADLGFNDLSACVKSMVHRLSALDYSNIGYFTLNSTNIPDSYSLALLLKHLCQLPNLKFLDLSGLPQVFPEVFPYLLKYLPRSKSLQRIHCDNNDFTYNELSVLCNILMKCETLTHISMEQPSRPQLEATEDSSFDAHGYWVTLYKMAKALPNLIALDVNYEEIQSTIHSKIALCLVAHMNSAMGQEVKLDEVTSQSDLLLDGAWITDSAEDILKRLTRLHEHNVTPTVTSEASDTTKRYLLKKYFESINEIHVQVQAKIDDMFERRKIAPLPFEQKENLVRLVILEKALTNILDLLKDIPEYRQLVNSDSSTLKTRANKHFEATNQPRHGNGELVDVNGSKTSTSSQTESEGDSLLKPHVMVTEDGKPIDFVTGRPILGRTSSSTSLTQIHGKEIEQEEGELHKWGFFVQQQKDIYPDTYMKNARHDIKLEKEMSASSEGTESTDTTETSAEPAPTSPAGTASSGSISPRNLILKIPSGPDLRNTIMKAKGINSIDDLIQSVNSNELHLESIYGANATVKATDNDREKVIKAYDKLLNNFSVARPEK